MKLPRILIMAGLAFAAASAAVTPASAQTVFHGPPQGYGYQLTYYTDFSKTTIVAINYLGCNGTSTWDGYNGNPDMTISQDYDYVEWTC